MKKIISVLLTLFLASGLLFFITSCAPHGNRVDFRYSGKLSDGSTIDIKFCAYFKDKRSKERAIKRESSYIHALHLMFSSYKKDQLSEPRMNNILKKAANRIFRNSVDEVEIFSIKYES